MQTAIINGCLRPLGPSLKRNRYFTQCLPQLACARERANFTPEKPSDPSPITKTGQTNTLCCLMPRRQGTASALSLLKAQNLSNALRRHEQTDPKAGHPANSCPGLFTVSRWTEQGWDWINMTVTCQGGSASCRVHGGSGAILITCLQVQNCFKINS